LKWEAIIVTENTVDETPIACVLSAADLADRRQAWRRLLNTSLLARERVPGGLRLTVRPGAGPQLTALVELERDCCPWITFATKGESVTMTAPGDGEEVLIRMFPV
jgi:hypothetical protein